MQWEVTYRKSIVVMEEMELADRTTVLVPMSDYETHTAMIDADDYDEAVRIANIWYPLGIKSIKPRAYEPWECGWEPESS